MDKVRSDMIHYTRIEMLVSAGRNRHMLQKICPTCDGKIKGNYCPFCRKIVLHPLTWEVGYYLNERRPTGEEYPETIRRETKSQKGPDLSTKAEKAMSRKDAEQAKKKEVDRYRKKAKALTRKVEKKSSGKVLILVIIVVILIVTNGIGLWIDYLSERAFSETEWATEMAEYSFDEAETLPEDIYGWLEEEGYSEEYTDETADAGDADLVYLDEEEVIARGEPCSGQAHFPLTYEAVKPAIDEILAGQGWTVTESEEDGGNVVAGGAAGEEAATYFSKLAWWDCFQGASQEEENYNVLVCDYDTVSGEIHELSGWFGNEDAAAEVGSQMASLLEREMGLSEEECCAEMVREAIMENSGNPEGYMEFYPGYILWVLNDGSISVILEPY